MSRTLGQELDDYLKDIYTVETVYIYQDKNAEPHVILTISNDKFSYGDVFSQDRNLTQDIELKKKKVIALQTKIRQLEKSKKDIIKAIELLRSN